MRSAPTEYIAATNLDEVLGALADGRASVLAGGQSLGPADDPGRIVDINGVAEFDLLALEDDRLRIGPLVRHRTFATGAVGGPLGGLLRQVIGRMGHPPVRDRGTVLGSLAHAHPGAEWPVAAVMFGAELDLVGAAGRRTVAADRFFTGPFATVRRPDEFLAEVRLPLPAAGSGTGYAEDRPYPGAFTDAAVMAVITTSGSREGTTDGREGAREGTADGREGAREGTASSRESTASSRKGASEGLVTAAAIGLVNAGPCPVRARAAEAALLGTTFGDAAILAAAEAAADLDANLAHLPEWMRSGRRRLIRLLSRRALTQARIKSAART